MIAHVLVAKQPKAHVAERAFPDTNILLYSISATPAESNKRAIAENLLNRANCAISLQILHEFYHQATHARHRNAISADSAWRLIGSWQRFDIQENNMDVLRTASLFRARTGYSIWDCLILSAAMAQGCTILYSEDMQHGRILDDLRIINPFREDVPSP